MSDYTDSLRDENDDEFKKFLLDHLSIAEDKCDRKNSYESGYWQGNKDAYHSVLALYLNMPEISTLSRSSKSSELFKEMIEELWKIREKRGE